ncbi:MAG: carbon starvation protein A [Leptospirales bacterium]
MSGSLLIIFGVVVYALGYRFYSKYLAEKVFKLDKNYRTPAHEFNDGIDFVPTNKYVLFGHHFTSIAGAAPILGPTIAVYWGWLPALLWVVFGTVFAAGIHDFGSIVISVRHDGNSMGTLANKIIGKRAKVLFLFIILILLLMVNAVFAWVISKLFIVNPSSILPVFIQIPLAVWIGYHVYKKKGKILIPSLIALVIMYVSAILSSNYSVLQLDLVGMLGGDEPTSLGFTGTEFSFFIWIIVLMIYGYIASVLPVWKLLQPRDFINSHQLIVGLAILYAGVFIMNPDVTAPAIQMNTDRSWFPLLFITIACGAISGFHGLVSSGTTSKQLDKETDARFVGYLGSVGEGSLALISLIAVATYFASEGDFLASYNSFESANGQGLTIFLSGAANLAGAVGIPVEIGKTIVAVIVISFAATSLDTAMRLMRYIINELGKEYKVNILTKKHVATSLGIGASALLAMLPQSDKGFGSGGFTLWPLFGTGNQLLAGITLLIITIWLKVTKKNFIPSLIPMLFLLAMTIWAMVEQVFYIWPGQSDSGILLFFGSIILFFAFWILVEGVRVVMAKTDEKEVE